MESETLSRRRIWCICFIVLFLGSIGLGLYRNEGNQKIDGTVIKGGNGYLTETDIPASPVESANPNNYTITGQDQANALLNFYGLCDQDSNTEKDMRISTQNWNISDILLKPFVFAFLLKYW